MKLSRILAVIIVFVLIVPTMSGISFADNNLNVGSPSRDWDNAIAVPILIQNESYQISAVQFDLAFDGDRLSFLEVESGELARGFNILSNSSNRTVRVVLYTMTESVVGVGTGTLVKARFRPKTTEKLFDGGFRVSNVVISGLGSVNISSRFVLFNENTTVNLNSSTPTPRPSPTATQRPAASSTPRSTVTPRPTATPILRPTATATPRSTASTRPSVKATATPTSTLKPTPKATSIPAPSATRAATATTQTKAPSPAPTATKVPTVFTGGNGNTGLPSQSGTSLGTQVAPGYETKDILPIDLSGIPDISEEEERWEGASNQSTSSPQSNASGASSSEASSSSQVSVSSAEVPSDGKPDVFVRLTSDKEAYEEGETVHYRIQYLNHSGEMARNVKITGTIPEDAIKSFAQADVVEFPLGNLEPFGEGEVDYYVTTQRIDSTDKILYNNAMVEFEGNEKLHERQSALRIKLYSTRTRGEHAPYMKGYPDGTFKPDGNITRAEMASILAKFIQEDGTAKQIAGFKDVPKEHWAYQSILKNASFGVFSGDAGGTFRPNAPISRGELVVVVSRMLKLKAQESPWPSAFTDTAGHWAKNDIEEAYRLGFVKGSQGFFSPNRPVTRAEAVTILNKALKRGPLTTTKSTFRDVPLNHWAFANVQEAASEHRYVNSGSAGEREAEEMVAEYFHHE